MESSQNPRVGLSKPNPMQTGPKAYKTLKVQKKNKGKIKGENENARLDPSHAHTPSGNGPTSIPAKQVSQVPVSPKGVTHPV